jgi:GTP-binding protein
VILVVDSDQDIAEQDAHIGGYILEAGRALAVAVNKIDAVDAEKRKEIKSDLERKLHFLDFAGFHPISARHGTGIKALLKSVDAAFAAAMAKLSTPKLTRALIKAVEQHQPPIARGIRPKLRYAHQGGSNPPIVVVHGSATADIKPAYRRYLEGVFIATFELRGTPLRVELRSGANPYAGKKKQILTASQERARRKNRLHNKKKFGN